LTANDMLGACLKLRYLLKKTSKRTVNTLLLTRGYSGDNPSLERSLIHPNGESRTTQRASHNTAVSAGKPWRAQRQMVTLRKSV
jgi:hypothetical protein